MLLKGRPMEKKDCSCTPHTSRSYFSQAQFRLKLLGIPDAIQIKVRKSRCMDMRAKWEDFDLEK
ncbi:hypothetical protein ACTXT7_004246 [Hymenolepis weldensis]